MLAERLPIDRADAAGKAAAKQGSSWNILVGAARAAHGLVMNID
jgi:hypothetical protein